MLASFQRPALSQVRGNGVAALTKSGLGPDATTRCLMVYRGAQTPSDTAEGGIERPRT